LYYKTAVFNNLHKKTSKQTKFDQKLQILLEKSDLTEAAGSLTMLLHRDRKITKTKHFGAAAKMNPCRRTQPHFLHKQRKFQCVQAELGISLQLGGRLI
jgi:hypothetical protein